MTAYPPSGRIVTIPASGRRVMVDHARREHPNEACGLLARNAAAAWTTAAVYEMENVEHSPIGYAMNPKEQLAKERTMRARGQALLGIYHSHTASEARPSPVDIQHALSPDLAYVLVAAPPGAEPVVRSFRVDGPTVTEDQVRVAAE